MYFSAELPNYLEDMIEGHEPQDLGLTYESAPVPTTFVEPPADVDADFIEPEAAPVPGVLVAEPVDTPEPVLESEPVAEPEEATAPEPEDVNEPVIAPEGVLVAEPVDTPEPVLESEPVAEPEEATAPEPGVTVDPIAEDVDMFNPDATQVLLDQDFFAYDGVAGNQFAWHNDWFYQEVDGYCGPSSVAIILNEFAGEGITNPEYMVAQALELGLMDDPNQGMYTRDIAELLSANGIGAEVQYSSIDDLATKLEMGYGVIACVDGGEVWLDNDTDIYSEDNLSDHALVVTQVDFNAGTVTLADPGSPDGNGLTVSIEQFEDAWADSNFEMVATTEINSDLVDPSMVEQHMAIVNATRSDVIG